MNQKNRIATVFATMAAVLVLSIAATFWMTQQTLQYNRSAARHRNALLNLREMLSTVRDAETGQRGYLLTGDAAYLEPYNAALAQIQNRLNNLKTIAAAGDIPAGAVQQLSDLADQKLAELNGTIELRSAGQTDAAIQRVRTGVGRQLMTSVRDIESRLVDEQNDEFLSAVDSAKRWATYSMLVFAAAVVINLLFLLWAYQKVRDEIVARQTASREVQRQKDLLEVTLQSIGDAVIVTANDSSIVFMNPVAQHLTGWTQQEAKSQLCTTIFNIVNEDTRQRVESPVDKVLRLGTIVGLANHTLLIRKDGVEVPIDDSGAPIRDPDGTVRGVVLVFRDFTEHKQNERNLRQAKEELEAASKAKDQFLAALSHELRTPLTPVLAILTAWEASDALPPVLLPDVQMLRRNVELEARLIDDLLDLTRIVKGKMPLHPEIVDAHDLLRNVAGMYESEIQTKKIDLSMKLEAARFNVYADPGRLQQVFWNILKNSVKFTPEKGAIRITTSNDPSGKIVMTFNDSGIGMSPELLGRLFRPFEQGTDEVVRRYGGLGLGMAISKALVDAQGGTITAASEGTGRGSTFTVTFDAVAARQQPAPVSPAAIETKSEDKNGVKILLVEDHEDSARVLAQLLRLKGHQVQIANSVAAAQAAMAKGEFDLLLSDIGLPDGTGIDLIRQVRQRNKVPAVALTGFGMEDDIAKCQEAGFNAHLTKPVNFQRLEILIREMAAK